MMSQHGQCLVKVDTCLGQSLSTMMKGIPCTLQVPILCDGCLLAHYFLHRKINSRAHVIYLHSLEAVQTNQYCLHRQIPRISIQ